MLSLSFSSTLLLSFLSVCHAAPSLNPPTLTRRDAAPLSTACGDVVRNASENSFPATLVYECLTSVPFHADISTKFLKYYADSVQFHSTLEFLKAPPAGYQQPATDLLGNLEQIQAMINTNQFRNQYDFEAALQSAILATHDDHLSLSAGILGVFSFGTRYRIVSLSKDGIELPKVYLSADIIMGLDDEAFKPSPIVKLDGQDVVKYLTAFAAKNAVGGRESHTDWNSLMINPAQVIQGFPSLWGGAATFYPGEMLTIELANTTVIETPWYGVFHGDSETGPLETGGDFYNSFVLGYLPASYEDSNAEDEDAEEASTTIVPRAATTSASTTKAARPKETKWNNIAYPTPDLAQKRLGAPGGGLLSAYFLKGSIAVLSVPSFQVHDSGIDEYSDFVGNFIKTSKAKGMKKVVIDLQRNFGGDALLATDMFKQFFPGKDKIPYGGSRLRGHRAANIIGKTLTGYWNTTSASDVESDEDDTDYYYLYSNEWVASTRINADTNKTFKSWEEFYGPHQVKGADFTTTQQYPLADTLFDTAASGSDESFVVYGYGSRPADTKQEYAAEDIIILTDGHCSSTCSLFVEMMHQEAGVRTVAAGGRPEYGPMQALGLSRGASQYSITTQLDSDIEDAKSILDFYNQTNDLLPGRSEGLDVEVYQAGINLRDQIRKGDSTPLQFKYDAATCRIFYTPLSIFNYTNLWQHAASAIWTRPELCVQDSTGYSSTGSSSNKLPPNNVIPSSSLLEIPDANIPEIVISLFGVNSAIQAVKKPAGTTANSDAKKAKAPISYVGQDCTGDIGDSALCPTNYFCDKDYVYCDMKKSPPKQKRAGCVLMCKQINIGGLCANNGGECYTRPELALWYDMDNTGKGFCSAPAKSKDVKCKKAVANAVTLGKGKNPAAGKVKKV